jgi:hypothetical protein
VVFQLRSCSPPGSRRTRYSPDAFEEPDKPAVRQPDKETVANLAYRYWQERGSPIGSPDQDWYRAERELRQPSRS